MYKKKIIIKKKKEKKGLLGLWIPQLPLTVLGSVHSFAFP
jgi:hypothetical protein